MILMTSLTAQTVYIDPSGTYQLDSKSKKKNGEIYGYFGQIQVKNISRDMIVMTFEVNKV